MFERWRFLGVLKNEKLVICIVKRMDFLMIILGKKILVSCKIIGDCRILGVVFWNKWVDCGSSFFLVGCICKWIGILKFSFIIM